jgi:hypothetical protein
VDRVADIVSLASRRQVRPPVRPAAAAHTPVRYPWGVAALVAVGLAFVAAVAVIGGDFGANVRALPAAVRDGLYLRALEDVESACALPAARDGALRDHCLGQARFLLTFSECDARCRQATASILPRARR